MGNTNEYYGKDPEEIFQDILDGKMNAFPRGYWKQPGVEDTAGRITRYFIENVLGWSENDLLGNVNEKLFRDHHLSGMLEFVFGRSPYEAIENAYPGRFKAWELSCVPRGFWAVEENRYDALRYLLRKTHKTKVNELTNPEFIRYGLGGLRDYLARMDAYSNMPLDIIENGMLRGSIRTNISFSIPNPNARRHKISARLEFPVEMLHEVGITENNNTVQISVRDGDIIITPQPMGHTKKQKRIMELYSAGHTQAEIARIMGCSRQNVSGKIKAVKNSSPKVNKERKPQVQRKPRVEKKPRGTRIDYTQYTDYSIFTPREVETLKLIQSGASLEETAARLGITVRTVSNCLHKITKRADGTWTDTARKYMETDMEKNREKRLESRREYFKRYYQENKEQIREKQRQRKKEIKKNEDKSM